MRRFVWMASVLPAVAALALGSAGPLAAAPMAADCHGGIQLGRYMIAFHSGPAEPDEPGMAAMPHRPLPKGMVYRHVEVHVMNARTCTPVVRRLPALTLISGAISTRAPLMRMGLAGDRHFGMDQPLRPGATYQAVVHLGSGVAFFVPFRVPRGPAAAAPMMP